MEYGLTTKQKIGLQLQLLRKRKKLSQEVLAERVEIDAKSLSRLERGAHYPSIETLERLARELGVELKDFFDFDKTPSIEQMRKMVVRTAHEAEPSFIAHLVNVIEQRIRVNRDHE